MTFSVGTPVTWIERARDGRVLRTVRTVAASAIQPVHCTDGQTVDCITLACHRFVRLADLVLGHDCEVEQEGTKSRRAAQSDSVRTPAAAVHAPTLPRSGDTSQQSQPSADALITAPDGGCSVLAIDFLNVLVRAWHAGAPTETHAVRSLFQTVANAIRTLRPQRVVFAMDGGHALRSKLLPSYKAHRPAPEPGLQKQKELAERALSVAGLQMIRVVDWEADDVLASLATAHAGVVVCSSDKDLLALAGRCRIYHPWGSGQFVQPEDKLGLPAGQVTDYLALCGDTSDGIPGVRGIGPKTALQLLQEHDNLEGILTAAVAGRIKGAVAAKLKDQRAAALLCRQIVELNNSLPLPELQPWRAPAGCQQQLQAMGLGSAAAVLESVASILEASEKTTMGRALSAATGQAEQGERVAGGNPGRPSAAAAVDQRGQDDAQPGLAHTNGRTDPDGESGRPVGESGSSASSHTSTLRIRRHVDEPLRNLTTVADRFDGPDKGCIFAWEQGRRASGTSSAESCWKQGSPLHAAWLQGYRLQDLDVTVGHCAEVVLCTSLPVQSTDMTPPAAATRPLVPAQRSLF